MHARCSTPILYTLQGGHKQSTIRWLGKLVKKIINVPKEQINDPSIGYTLFSSVSSRNSSCSQTLDDPRAFGAVLWDITLTELKIPSRDIAKLVDVELLLRYWNLWWNCKMFSILWYYYWYRCCKNSHRYQSILVLILQIKKETPEYIFQRWQVWRSPRTLSRTTPTLIVRLLRLRVRCPPSDPSVIHRLWKMHTFLLLQWQHFVVVAVPRILQQYLIHPYKIYVFPKTLCVCCLFGEMKCVALDILPMDGFIASYFTLQAYTSQVISGSLKSPLWWYSFVLA